MRVATWQSVFWTVNLSRSCELSSQWYHRLLENMCHLHSMFSILHETNMFCLYIDVSLSDYHQMSFICHKSWLKNLGLSSHPDTPTVTLSWPVMMNPLTWSFTSWNNLVGEQVGDTNTVNWEARRTWNNFFTDSARNISWDGWCPPMCAGCCYVCISSVLSCQVMSMNMVVFFVVRGLTNYYLVWG